MMPVATMSSMPIMAGGFKIILKDAKIYANKVIITTQSKTTKTNGDFNAPKRQRQKERR